DPLVGGHLLYGLALGVGLVIIETVRVYGVTTNYFTLISVLDARRFASVAAQLLTNPLLEGMAFTFTMMLLRVLLRRQWLAWTVFALLAGLLGIQGPSPGIGYLHGVIRGLFFGACLFRFGGLITVVACGFVGGALS